MSNEDAEEQTGSFSALEPFLVKGDSLSIPNLTISIRDDGEMELEPIAFYTGSDMCSHWLSIYVNRYNWWYAAFCFRNARMVVSFALQIIIRSAGSPRREDYVNLDLAKYCRALLLRTKPLIDVWES